MFDTFSNREVLVFVVEILAFKYWCIVKETFVEDQVIYANILNVERSSRSRYYYALLHRNKKTNRGFFRLENVITKLHCIPAKKDLWVANFDWNRYYMDSLQL